MQLDDGYKLLDSGDGRKLERFGGRTISRPSSLSTWKRREDLSEWEAADATLHLNRGRGNNTDDSGGWEFASTPFSTWKTSVLGVTLELELMSNGQLGIFPEHQLYLLDLERELTRLASTRLTSAQPIRVLNLFAYTGLATCFCGKRASVSVTHVDMAKRAIERAKSNAALNEIPPDKIRWIVDDALAFMAREARKGSRYDVVIIDPPSFSRVSKTNSWTLDDKLAEIVHLVLGVVQPLAGAIFFTNHSSASTVDITRNIALDYLENTRLEISTTPLSIKESRTDRRLPAGSLIKICYGL